MKPPTVEGVPERIVGEVRQRIGEMRKIADDIATNPDGIADADDVEAWRRDAELLEMLLSAALLGGEGDR